MTPSSVQQHSTQKNGTKHISPTKDAFSLSSPKVSAFSFSLSLSVKKMATQMSKKRKVSLFKSLFFLLGFDLIRLRSDAVISGDLCYIFPNLMRFSVKSLLPFFDADVRVSKYHSICTSLSIFDFVVLNRSNAISLKISFFNMSIPFF